MAEEKREGETTSPRQQEAAAGTAETAETSETTGTTATEQSSQKAQESPKPESAAQESQESQSSQESQEPAKPAKPAEVEWKDLYARLRADFDNFKKRTARDREETYRYAESDILKDILPTVDNLALALANAAKDDSFVQGVQLVYDTLLKALKDHGAEPFDSVGQSLDTEKMEAIATLPSETIEEGKVSNEVKRGWMLKGKVLRVAQVVVSSGAGS